MRTAFIHELILHARHNKRVFLLVGDLGYSVVEPYAREFPGRFLNVGVAEQNMTGLAAGLASEGYHVFTYSIANFPTLRCFEQIRNDICYHGHSVTVVSVGAGLAYGNLGYSHHAVQDLSLMRGLPNMTVMSPADPGEVRECVQYLTSKPSPSYLRLGKAGERDLHNVRGIISGPLCIRKGNSNVAFVATGSVLSIALDAAHELDEQYDIDTSVYSCPFLHTASENFYAPLFGYKTLVTIEEHVIAGGLGEMLSGIHPGGGKITKVAIPSTACYQVGSQDFLRHSCGLNKKHLVELCLSDIRSRR